MAAEMRLAQSDLYIYYGYSKSACVACREEKIRECYFNYVRFLQRQTTCYIHGMVTLLEHSRHIHPSVSLCSVECMLHIAHFMLKTAVVLLGNLTYV